MSEKIFYITTPIYYVNSTPHIGHAYTQIAADARARFERMRGREVYFLTGTDENAEKVARVARELGREPQEFCDELSAAFRTVWDKLNISYDDYIRTTEERHRKVAAEIVAQLWNNGQLEVGSYAGWYSVSDETFFRTEETVERDGARYIANPTEDQSKLPLEWIEESTHYFKLSNYGEFLLDYYRDHPDVLGPESRRNETLSYIRSGLRDTSISRGLDWGIALPPVVPQGQGHVIYVWFEALMNYLSAPGYLSDDPKRRELFERCWPPDLQLMSKDIFTRFHATLWPAMLSAINVPLPRALFAHGFWTVNGRKMSKRDPETIIEPVAFAGHIAKLAGCDFETGVDALRYYSLREVTFGSDGDFSRVGCLNRYNSDLANGLGNLVNRALSMLHQYFEGVIPDVVGAQLGLLQSAEDAGPDIAEDFSTLNYSGALNRIWEVVALGNRVIEEQKPWARIKAGETNEVGMLLRELLGVCQWCSVTLAPIMPHAMNRLRSLIALPDAVTWNNAIAWNLLPAGHTCLPPQPLFPRIPKITEEIAMEIETNPDAAAPVAASQTAAPATEAPAAEPTAEKPNYIEYADFAKVQLRTARVLSAERVPKADKLLRLQVDLGTEQRQILAGLAQYWEPEALVGKTVVVVANLAPRQMRGFESQGMLLAASETADGPPGGLVTIDTDLPPGSVIR